MIEGNEYVQTIKDVFSFLEFEFGLVRSNEKINGCIFYDVEYRDSKKVISISFENLENYLLIIISLLENGHLPDYDNKSRTLHLNELTRNIIPNLNKDEIKLNSEYFKKFKTANKFKNELVKKAKDLRMCLLYLKTHALPK